MPGSEDVKPVNPDVKLTYEDFVHFPDDGKRHELIDGEHYVTAAPIRKHQAIVMNLSGLIWSYLQQRPLGRVYGTPFDVIFSDYDVVEPDLIYISHDRARQIETSPWVRGAPDLVVEVGSPSTRRRDETIKRRLYERFGVQEYWIVDAEIDAIKVFRRVDERYERVAELLLENDDVLTTPLLPELQMRLARIFEE
jgi:Uma2 family endonuclease